MIIFLYGADTFRSRQKLNEIIERYRGIHKSGLNLKYFNGEDLKFDDFRDEFQQTSMFAEKKLLVLENVSSNQDFKDKFLENSKKLLSSDDVILFYEKGIPKADKFLIFLKKKTKSEEFEILEGVTLRNWIKKEFAKYSAKISAEILEKMVELGGDLWQINNEIKKLVSFSGGRTIGVKDIEFLVKPEIETSIFKTIDAIALRNKKKAISLIHQHMEKGDAPLYLLSMINFQFRNILMVKELMEKHHPYYLISKITKLHPFVVRKSYEEAGKFTFIELKKIYQKIYQADFSIKTGRIEPETAIDLLIAGI